MVICGKRAGAPGHHLPEWLNHMDFRGEVINAVLPLKSRDNWIAAARGWTAWL
jgi:hypothetical protein